MFTVSAEADQKITEDIGIIRQIIHKYWEPVSIIMFGGFGHGEGSFKEDNGQILPLNDYDMYIVTKKPVSAVMLEKVGDECSEAIGAGGVEIVEKYDTDWDERECFHVDLHNIVEAGLPKLYPTQRTADLKTSIVVEGDRDILENIPDVRISASDAIRMLFNKLNHFQLAERNNAGLKQIYAVKGFTDLASSLLIFYGGYSSGYRSRRDSFAGMDFPEELKELVTRATEAKLYHGYKVDRVDEFFEKSRKWVEWGLKKILKDHLDIESENWIEIAGVMYKKLPYKYFNDYLGSGIFFSAQYYLNIRFFIEALRKGEFLPGVLFRWKDSGLILGISLILFSVGEKEESEKYLRKISSVTSPLIERLLKLYAVYYLQKMI